MIENLCSLVLYSCFYWYQKTNCYFYCLFSYTVKTFSSFQTRAIQKNRDIVKKGRICNHLSNSQCQYMCLLKMFSALSLIPESEMYTQDACENLGQPQHLGWERPTSYKKDPGLVGVPPILCFQMEGQNCREAPPNGKMKPQEIGPQLFALVFQTDLSSVEIISLFSFPSFMSIPHETTLKNSPHQSIFI